METRNTTQIILEKAMMYIHDIKW